MTDMPSAFASKNRKARKPHGCCECRREIKKGDVYRYSSGIWDGEARDFKQCLNCAEIMDAAARSTDYSDEGPCFCDLREWFDGFLCVGFQGEDWLNGMAEDIGVAPEKLNKLLKVEG